MPARPRLTKQQGGFRTRFCQGHRSSSPGKAVRKNGVASLAYARRSRSVMQDVRRRAHLSEMAGTSPAMTKERARIENLNPENKIHSNNIIGIYERHAAKFDALRTRSLFEKAWLERFAALMPKGGKVLDLGCGMGEPVARYFIEAGFDVTGVDGSAPMIELCRARFPQGKWIVGDMRAIALGETFHGILGWDSYFFLPPADQRRMFSVFRDHAAPNAALLFNTGPRAGEAMGEFAGEPLYHASLDAQEYRALLKAYGFEVVAHQVEDAQAGGRTIWLARRLG
jgi:SAM-dependent methyltransferase